MSVCCTIGILEKNSDKVQCVCCLKEGNLMEVGLKLYLGYNSVGKIKQLISYGTLRNMGYQLPDKSLMYTRNSKALLFKCVDARYDTAISDSINGKEGILTLNKNSVPMWKDYNYVYDCDKNCWLVFVKLDRTRKLFTLKDIFEKETCRTQVREAGIYLAEEQELLNAVRAAKFELSDRVSLVNNFNNYIQKNVPELRGYTLSVSNTQGQPMYSMYAPLRPGETSRVAESVESHPIKAIITLLGL